MRDLRGRPGRGARSASPTPASCSRTSPRRDGVAAMGALLAPGGAVVLEDIDFTGAFCHPETGATGATSSCTARPSAGGAATPTWAPACRRSCNRAGLHDVEVRVAQPVALTGPDKRVTLLTLERIAPAVVAERVAGEAEVAAPSTSCAPSPRTRPR